MQNLVVISLFLFTGFVSSFSAAYDFSEEQKRNVKLLMNASLHDDTGYRIVESLTTEVGPRLAGSEAEKRARDWAVRQFESLKFENVRVDTFSVPRWERGIETAEVTSPFPQKLSVTALGGSVATPADGVEGELHIFPNLGALKSMKNNAMAGKIVFVDESMARTQDGSGYAVAVAKRGQAAFEAHRVGAVAALIRSVGTSSHRFPHTGQMKSITDKNPGASVPAAALSAPDADQLARISHMSEHVRIKLILTPEVLPASTSGNVIAEIPGSKKDEEIVLIGAHLDSWDLGTGAVDDGAGVGIVMAAAHLINTTLQQRPRRTVRVVLFGAEEVGLVGAKSYTDTYQDQLDLHIVAAESDFGAGVIWRLGSANVAEEKHDVFTAVTEMLSPLKIIPGDNTSSGGPDMKYLKEAGVPIADLRQDGRDYFDLHHTADDTFDKVDPVKLRQNIAAYAAFVYLVADMEERFR